MAAATISCEKQKARYALPHDQSRLPHRPDHERSAPGAVPAKEEREKNLLRLVPRNPLKSLDPDERIQGNPRKSNPHKRGPSQRNAMAPRKPKTASDRPPKALDRLHPNATRFSPGHFDGGYRLHLVTRCAVTYGLRDQPSAEQKLLHSPVEQLGNVEHVRSGPLLRRRARDRRHAFPDRARTRGAPRVV